MSTTKTSPCSKLNMSTTKSSMSLNIATTIPVTYFLNIPLMKCIIDIDNKVFNPIMSTTFIEQYLPFLSMKDFFTIFLILNKHFYLFTKKQSSLKSIRGLIHSNCGKKVWKIFRIHLSRRSVVTTCTKLYKSFEMLHSTQDDLEYLSVIDENSSKYILNLLFDNHHADFLVYHLKTVCLIYTIITQL